MTKVEQADILLDAVLELVVIPWNDVGKIQAGILNGLYEIERRRQETGPEYLEIKEEQ